MPFQGEDGFGDDGHPVGADAGSAKDLPGFQLCHGAFDWGSGLGEGAVEGALGGGEFSAGWSFEAGGDVRSGAGVGAVGEDWDALAFADTDGLVGAGGGQVVGAARKGG